ncbi:MAG: DUF4251 domain-containing protein [Bacteroidales bacterium]|jgi:hypothetical protein|nr:DUF4251 domain-containing protein [Bacteroidales bacterium]
MKRFLLSVSLISVFIFSSLAQNKKAERDSIAVVKFQKAAAALEAKDFVIIVEYYATGSGTFEANTDAANFLSYEKEFVILQGQIVAGNSNVNKLTISDFNQVTDKKGNISVEMQGRGFFITAKIEILLKKGGNTGDVIITPTKGDTKRFSGEIVPRAESKYFRRAGEI